MNGNEMAMREFILITMTTKQGNFYKSSKLIFIPQLHS